MTRLYKLGIGSSILMVCLGWLLNCTAFESRESPRPLAALNTRDVVYSDWITTEQWVSTNLFGLPARSCDLSQSGLTSKHLENGQLYVYTKFNEEIKQLPFTVSSEEDELRFDYTIAPNATLRLVEIGLRGSLKPNTVQKSFRYVLIPNAISNKMLVDMNDYEAVQAAFSLSE